MDPRKEYVSRCALDALGVGGSVPAGRKWGRPATDLISSLQTSRPLQDFVESPSVGLLQISVVTDAHGQHDIAISSSVNVASDCAGGVVFTKRSAEELSAENISTIVLMTTFQASPLQTFYLMIKELYAPLLLEDPHWASQLDVTTRHTLQSLTTELSSTVRRGHMAVYLAPLVVLRSQPIPHCHAVELAFPAPICRSSFSDAA